MPPARTMCRKHPSKPAVAACKRCSAAVCSECKIMMPEGPFCSMACVQEFREFQSRIWAKGGPRRRFSVRATIRYLITVALLLAVIMIALSVWLGTTDPAEMWENLRRQLRLLF
jgi:hypothetical protein